MVLFQVEHGSTIILFLPKGMALADTLIEGQAIRAGEVVGRV